LIDRYYVPHIVGNDIGYEEINFISPVRFGGVSFAAAGGNNITGTAAGAGSGSYLDAPEALARIEDEVVAFAVSIGFGHSEAEACRLVQEREFRQFAFSWTSPNSDAVNLNRSIQIPGAFVVLRADAGSFDSASASLRDADAALRMTGYGLSQRTGRLFRVLAGVEIRGTRANAFGRFVKKRR
jgi:hypothetical protein